MSVCPLHFAIIAHGDQKYGEHPYSYHLKAVAAVLARFGYEDFALVSASYLHDVVEDTPVTVEEVSALFGPEVADLVSRVTMEPAPNRKAKLAEAYPRIAANPKAVALKLADRIANVEECLKTRSSLLAMYRREYEGFRKELRTEGAHCEMWSHLGHLFAVDNSE